jgi:hypothetical protein
MKPLVSICIPIYYSGPETPRVLGELIHSINIQTYSSILVLASIQPSEDIAGNKRMMSELSKCTKECRVIGCSGRGPAANTNSAIGLGVNCGHRYIKIMNQDDLLDSRTAIADMVATLEKSDAKWLASMCTHTDSEGVKRERPHQPRWPGEKAMVEGVNQIGCPSAIMFDSSLTLKCDPKILYAMDCDMWIQLYRQAGPPAIHLLPDVVVRMWESQLTQNLDIPKQLESDKRAMRMKYGYT